MMPVFGLYTHIRANRIRSIFLIGALFALIYVLTFAGALAGEALKAGNLPLDRIVARAVADLGSAFPIVTLGTGLWVVVSYWANQSIIGLALSANAVTRQQEPKLYNMLEKLCISRGMTMPRLEILETDVPNAYATGVNDKQYAITVTRGLMNLLDDQEMEAVLGHELTHIRNGDVKMMIVAMVVAGVVAFFAEMFFRIAMSPSGGTWTGSSSGGSSDSRERGKGGGAVAALAIAALIVAAAWVLSLMIRLALSRSREFLADAGSVELTKNPDAMISALRKIDGKGEIKSAPSGIMEMCLDNPRSGFADLFSTHPSIEARVAALKNYAGGREELSNTTGPPPQPSAPEAATAPPAPRRGPWG